MKVSKIASLALVLVLSMVVILSISRAEIAYAETIYVNDDAPGSSHDGSSWNKAYINLQSALDSAGAGDEIWVASGTYKPTEPHGMPDPEPADTSRYQSFQLKNDVAIYGGFAGGETSLGQRDWEGNLTVLSGDIGIADDNSDNCYHVFYHPEGSDLNATAVLDGFVITGGNANATYSAGRDHKRGGGMYNQGLSATTVTSPTIANCTFSDNHVSGSYSYGGGMYNYKYSSPMISNCIFSGNSCEYYGGGLYNSYHSSPTVSDCLFNGNYAGRPGDTGSYGSGGGMYNSAGSPILTGCTFDSNTSKYDGGGMYNNSGSNPYMIDCIFRDNSSDKQHGGGMFNSSSSPNIVNCIFSGNKAMATARHGGAMHNFASSPTITNCILYKNEAGCYGDGINNHQFSDPVITNCILWSYTGDSWPDVIFNTGSSDPVVTYCDVQGGAGEAWFGTGCIDEDPLFADPENGDFHLQSNSPCIDAGNNSALPEDTFDIDNDGDTTEAIPYDFEGDDRRIDDPSVVDTGSGDAPVVDMGVDELVVVEACEGDFDNDGDVDGSDLAVFAADFGRTDCSPADPCAGDFDYDGDADGSDLAVFAAEFGRTDCPINP